uniref:Uncharacterized protein n=1 Tax=uncultured marine virus TaxID=186617 RepID=A0A0F7L260_9VIRU|nr:hypothetical protein [uncultured marine virus]
MVGSTLIWISRTWSSSTQRIPRSAVMAAGINLPAPIQERLFPVALWTVLLTVLT